MSFRVSLSNLLVLAEQEGTQFLASLSSVGDIPIPFTNMYCGPMTLGAVVMGLLVTSPLAGQEIVIGSAAARQFVYNGKRVHPFCVGFPQEASSRSVPFLLSMCSDTKVVPKSNPDGWLEAEYPREAATSSCPSLHSFPTRSLRRRAIASL